MEFYEVNRQSPWQQIADITTLLVEQMEAIGSPMAEKAIKQAMENALKPGTSARFFLCYDGDAAAGCCVLNIGSGIEAGGDYIWINEFHVRDNMRLKGIGAALLEYVLKWASEDGYQYIAGVTGPQNQAAQRLFKKHGFEASEMVWLVRKK